MNLSRAWIPLLGSRGWDAIHWTEVGRPNAPDTELLDHARESGRIVLTQDLDFGQLLFHSNEAGPSVIVLRLANEFDGDAQSRVCDLIAAAERDLQAGALLTISANHARIRKLPIKP